MSGHPSHRLTFLDVERSFRRYKSVTQDHGAQLVRDESGSVIATSIEGEWNGGPWLGAPSAVIAIDAYVTGYSHGMEDGLAMPENAP